MLRDLSLSVDGERLRLRLVSAKFPDIEEMKEGRGEIQIEFIADVRSTGRNRKLVFENHHQSRIGAYLVNCLVPRDPIDPGDKRRNAITNSRSTNWTTSRAVFAGPAALHGSACSHSR